MVSRGHWLITPPSFKSFYFFLLFGTWRRSQRLCRGDGMCQARELCILLLEVSYCLYLCHLGICPSKGWECDVAATTEEETIPSCLAVLIVQFILWSWNLSDCYLNHPICSNCPFSSSEAFKSPEYLSHIFALPLLCKYPYVEKICGRNTVRSTWAGITALTLGAWFLF
jgi:hypothetical protein